MSNANLRSRVILGLTALLSLSIGCGSDGGDDGGTDPPMNRVPTVSVSGEAAFRVLIEGDVVDLTATANDADGDALTYTWTTVPATAGSFDDATVATPAWTVGAAENGLVEFRCEVSDGVNDPVAAQGASVELGTQIMGADYAADQTWAVADEPFVIRGDVRVLSGVTLTIEPGVHVYFRPTSSGPGSFERHQLRVEGTLLAVGTGTTSASSIRFRGDRLDSGDDLQHEGLHFVGSSTGTLHFVTVRDGDVGIAVSTSEQLSVFNCTFSDGSAGVELNRPADVMLRRVRVEDNSIGIVSNAAQLFLRESRVQGNSGPGLKINGGDGSSLALANVDSCEFRDNGSVHVDVSAGVAAVSLQVNHSNLLPRGEGENSIRLSASSCFQLALALKTNFWSQQAEVAQDVYNYFEGSVDCATDVLTWDRASGDWVTLAHSLSLP